MAATATYSFPAGFFHAWIAFRDTNGYPKGTDSTPDVVVNGTVLGAYKLPAPVSATSPALTTIIATFKGGQKILGKRDLGVDDLGTFEIVLPAYDETFNAYVTGSAVDVTTQTEVAATAPNSQNATTPQFILGLVTGFQTASGTNEYATIVYPSVQISRAIPGASTEGGDNPGALTFTVTPSLSTRAVTGDLYSATALNLVDDKDVVTIYRYSKPFMVATYIDDGSTGSFTLPYLPTSSDETGAAVNRITKNGATLIVTSVATATGLVTQTAFASAGDIIVVFYATDFLTV